MNEREIFQAAVDIQNSAERAEFLEKVCQGQSSLKHNVEILLRHYEDAGSFLERPPAEIEQTRLFDEQATDENSLAPAVSSDGPISDEALRHYLSPSDTPGVLGRLDQYEVLEKIGQGGMGIVLKGKDTKLHRIVAIKLLAPELASNPMARKRFLREAQAAAAVTHDHVVRIYAVSDSPNMPMLVMEYIDGQSLQQKLDKTGALEIKEILRIGLQAALGLAAAHKQGLVHRDIKPGNILLENGIQRVKITDFGLARAVDDIGMTTTGQITGTPQYMSPEQAQGELVDYRSDLFSLGSVMYAMCTGRAAFRADSTIAVLRRVCDDDPRPIREINPEIPLPLVDIVEQLMEKDPEHRFQSAEEVAEILSDLLAQIQQPGGLPANAFVKTPKGQTLPLPKRFRPFSWGKLLLALGIVFAGFCISEATGVTRLASTIIRIVNGDGTLIIETDDPSLEVTVEGQGSRQEVRVTGMGVNLTLKPGDYKVTASKNGEPVMQDLVTVTRNGKNVVRISHEGKTEVAAQPLSDELQRHMAFMVKAARGQLAESERKTLTKEEQSLREMLDVPVGKKILELFAALPEQGRRDLVQTGYVKWPYEGLSETYRTALEDIVTLLLKDAQEMGFGGKASRKEGTRDILKNALVGFAVVDFPNSQRAITFFIIMPRSPVPIAMPIVPELLEAWESLHLDMDQFAQLKTIAQKPNSFYPPAFDASLLNRPERLSLESKSKLIVKDGFRPVWTPDGKQILFSQHGNKPMQIYDLATGESKPFLTQADLEPNAAEPKSILDPAISPDGKTIAVVQRPVGHDNQAYFQEEIFILPFTGGEARRVMGGYPSFGNDSSVLYFQDRKRNMLCSVRLDENGAKAEDVMPCPAWYPVVSPDGKLVAYSERGTLHIVSLADRTEIANWTCPEPASGMLLSWSPNSSKLGLCPYGGQSRVGFWCFDLNTKEPTRISNDPIGEVAWSPDGKQLAYTLHREVPRIYVIETDTIPGFVLREAREPEPLPQGESLELAEVRQFQGHTGPVKQVAFSPDGKFAVSGSGWPAGDRTVRIWDVETGRQLRYSGTLSKAVMTVAFSPDGQLVAGGGFDGQVYIREASSGEHRHSLPANTEVVEDVIFSPDGKTLLSIGHKRAFGSDKQTIPDLGKAVLWELETQKLLWQFDRPGWLKTGAFSPDGTRVYVSGAKTGAAIHVLDAKTGQPIQQFDEDGVFTSEVEELAVSPDGQFLATASASGAVHLWNTADTANAIEQQVDSDRLLTITFTPDGSHLLTGGHGGTIYVLNAKTLEKVASQKHPSGSVWHLAVSPDSSHVLSAGGTTIQEGDIKSNGDYALRLWQLKSKLTADSPTADPE